MSNYRWKSVNEVHNKALSAINKPIRDLVSSETLQKYYDKPNNKGWIGNSIESDWFYIPNNSRNEADIPYLDLEIKVTPIKMTKAGWSAKERLVLNIFDFHDEVNRTFENASFLEKANQIELMYYEHIEGTKSPDLIIKNALTLDLKELPYEDQLIIKNDWLTITDVIKQGKAEELSDSLTQYLGATTKGSKTEANMTTQPFSDVKAHRRSFTLKTCYMTSLARKYMDEDYISGEKLITNTEELEVRSFEDIIKDKFTPYIGKSKTELAQLFNVKIPDKNDKASSRIIANKMLNINGDADQTEEFEKANIALKIVTVDTRGKKQANKTTEGFKLQNWTSDFTNVDEQFEESRLYEYLTETKFLLAVYEVTDSDEIFRGVTFWRMPLSHIENEVKHVFEDTKEKIKEGVILTYKEGKHGNSYIVTNNLIKISDNLIVHVRPDAVKRSYVKDSNAMHLDTPFNWINKPTDQDDILSSHYMTKQAYWINPNYMFSAVSNLLTIPNK